MQDSIDASNDQFFSETDFQKHNPASSSCSHLMILPNVIVYTGKERLINVFMLIEQQQSDDGVL